MDIDVSSKAGMNNAHGSMTPGVLENSMGTTDSTNDAMSVQTRSLHPATLDADIVNTGSTMYMQGIKEFLAKPVIILQGVYNTTDTLGLEKDFFVMNALALQSVTVWWPKLQGFMCLRATMRIRLQVNANPFQQGRSLIYYEPCTDAYQYPAAPGATTGRWDRSSLTAYTQMPNSQLDFGCDTECTLDIPYIHLQSHLNLATNTGGWGTLHHVVYSPLNVGTGGDTTAPYTVWASLIDVELVTPTQQIAVFPQMDNRKSNQKRRGKEPSSKEKAAQAGPISTVLNTVQSVAEAVKGVPLLSSIAGPVSWVSGVGSSIASYFGWSKPLCEMPHKRILNTRHQFTNVADSVENAYSLGLFTTAAVSPCPGVGGVDIDEMSIDYVKGIYAYFSTTLWTNAMATDTELITLPIQPSFYWKFRTLAAIDATPVAYLAQMFKQWRGSIKFRFKIPKTQFHSGRLLIAFEPMTRMDDNGNFESTPTVTNQSSDYIHRQIIDLRESSEFELIVPYAAVIPYLEQNTPAGILHVRILNALRAPQTAASSVNIIVEVAGGPDLEFAIPSPSTLFYPLPYVNPLSLAAAEPSEDLEAQMDNGSSSMNENCEFLSRVIGSADVPLVDTTFASTCVGEQPKSLKQLLYRACWKFTSTAVNQTTRPFRITSGLSPNDRDYFSIIAPLYLFSRGGVVNRAIDIGNASSSKICSVDLYIDRTTAINGPIGFPNNQMSSRVIEQPFTNMFATYVPHYGSTFGRLNSCDDAQLGALFPYRSSMMVRYNNTVAGTGTALNMQYARTAADDLHMSFFIGVPTCTLIG